MGKGRKGGGEMIRCMLGMLAVLLLSLGCSETSDQADSDFPDGQVAFEVDYQDGCDPFKQNGELEVYWKFPNCCKPLFEIDATSLEDTMIVYTAERVHDFWWDNCYKECYANCTEDTNWHAIYKYWMGGIKQFKYENGQPVTSVAGWTHQDEIKETYSVICRDVIDAGEPKTLRETHTVCHELGHQLAWLPHLESVSCDEHGDDSCLMGQYRMSDCAHLTDLLTMIHFCDTCRVKLCDVEGIER
jgi:hypothetical protein